MWIFVKGGGSQLDINTSVSVFSVLSCKLFAIISGINMHIFILWRVFIFKVKCTMYMYLFSLYKCYDMNNTYLEIQRCCLYEPLCFFNAVYVAVRMSARSFLRHFGVLQKNSFAQRNIMIKHFFTHFMFYTVFTSMYSLFEN